MWRVQKDTSLPTGQTVGFPQEYGYRMQVVPTREQLYPVLTPPELITYSDGSQ